MTGAHAQQYLSKLSSLAMASAYPQCPSTSLRSENRRRQDLGEARVPGMQLAVLLVMKVVRAVRACPLAVGRRIRVPRPELCRHRIAGPLSSSSPLVYVGPESDKSSPPSPSSISTWNCSTVPAAAPFRALAGPPPLPFPTGTCSTVPGGAFRELPRRTSTRAWSACAALFAFFITHYIRLYTGNMTPLSLISLSLSPL